MMISLRRLFARYACQSKYPTLWRGLIGAWCPALGPTGATLRDWSGFHSHGALTNFTLANAWVVRGGNYGILFDGTGYVGNLSFGKQPQGNVPTTVSAWVQFANSASAIEVINFFGQDSAANKSAYFLYRSAAGKAVSEFGSGFGAATGATTLAAGTWYHVAGVYNGITNKVFVNGIEDGSVSFSTANFSNTQQSIGAFLSPTPELRASAVIDDVRVYDRALTANEINLLYSGGMGRGIAFSRRTAHSYRRCGFIPPDRFHTIFGPSKKAYALIGSPREAASVAGPKRNANNLVG